MKVFNGFFWLFVFSIYLLLTDIVPSFAQDNITTIYDTAPLKRSVYVSKDEQSVIFVYDDHLELWNAHTGEKVAETTKPLFIDIPLVYSSTGQRIAWTVDGQYVAVVDMAENAVAIYERGNEIPLYTVVYEESEDFRVEGVLWRSDGAIWIPVGLIQNDIRFHRVEDGVVIRQIVLDTEQYTYPVSFYGLQFEPDGDLLAAGRNSAGRSDIRVYDSNILEERIVFGERETGSFPISFHWFAQSILNYCINPSVYGPEGNPESESLIHNLETDYTTSIPVCITDVSPDGQYGVHMNIEAEIEIVDLATGNVIDSLALTEFSDTNSFTLYEVTSYFWGVDSIIIYRGIPLTIWRPELPSD